MTHTTSLAHSTDSWSFRTRASASDTDSGSTVAAMVAAGRSAMGFVGIKDFTVATEISVF